MRGQDLGFRDEGLGFIVAKGPLKAEHRGALGSLVLSLRLAPMRNSCPLNSLGNTDCSSDNPPYSLIWVAAEELTLNYHVMGI